MRSDRLSPGGPAWKRLRWAARTRLGAAGLAGLLLLVLAATLALAVRPGLRSEQTRLLRAHVARLDAGARAAEAASAVAGRTDPRDAARERLPGWSQRLAVDMRLLAMAEAADLSVRRGEYAVEMIEPALVRQRVTLPLSGGYPGLRAFLAAVLDGLPGAALDGLELEQGDDGLSGRILLSLYFREDGR